MSPKPTAELVNRSFRVAGSEPDRLLASAVATEASRLMVLIPESKRTGFLADELGSAIDGLAGIGPDVASGRTYLALRKLAIYQEMVASSAFWYSNEPAAKDPARFESLWERTGAELRPGALSGAFEHKSAAVRAHVEIALNRIEPHYRASRLYARAGEQAGGLFYLGSARADLEFVRFCSTLPDVTAGDPPDLDGLADAETELSRRALEAYDYKDAATTHHRDFIRLDAALKEARELLRDGRRYGAAASLLEARLRLGIVTASSGTTSSINFDSVAYKARLADPARDHSLAQELWERAVEAAESNDEAEQRIAAVILSDVIPFYFDRLIH